MTYRIIYSDELYHHGVKSMRWGVRNDKRASGARAKAALVRTAGVVRNMARTYNDSVNRGTGGIDNKHTGAPKDSKGGPKSNKVPKGALSEKSGKVSLSLRSKNSTYRSDNLRAKLSNPKTKERVKKGAKIAAKVLGGAALTYAVVKIPNTKAYIKGVSVVAEKAVKPIPGTKYLYRQAKLADNINRASDYASKGLAAAMIGGTAYKAGKKYKVVERNSKRG